MARVRITSRIAIDEGDLEERFVLSSGPGGQNVNKVASAVQLRFDILHAQNLSDDLRARLRKLGGHRVTREGILVLNANRHRSQERNRADARERLFALIRAAAVVPPKRKKTKPPAASKERRIKGKLVRGMLKRARAKPEWD